MHGGRGRATDCRCAPVTRGDRGTWPGTATRSRSFPAANRDDHLSVTLRYHMGPEGACLQAWGCMAPCRQATSMLAERANGTTEAPPLRQDGPQGWIPFSDSLAERGTPGCQVA